MWFIIFDSVNYEIVRTNNILKNRRKFNFRRFCLLFAKQQEFVTNYFCGIAFMAFFIFPGPVGKLAFNSHLFAFIYKLLNNTGGLTPGHNIMPICLLYFFTFGIGVVFIGCNGEFCQLLSGFKI